MSNKIALATIQFRADAKGANVALDSLRASAKEARKTVDEMQEALNRGIKTMTDANGVKFDVEAKLKAAKKEANNFEQAIRELMKGATALESVVKNIELGEIEKNSRAELKGAINAAQSRLRSIREKDENGQLNEEDLQRQRELNIVISESQKQLNRLDRDTEKVIETIRNGGTVAESVLKKEQEGLEKILAMIPKGTDEYKKYAAQLKEIQTYVANIRQQEQAQATALLSDKNLGKYSEEQIRAAISSARELIQTYKTASPEAKALADNIVRAEQHLKDYGIEAARAAARETAQIKTQEEAEKQLRITMNKRLKELPKLSAEALVETKKYWEAQRNGAEVGSKELARYEANLKKVMNQEKKRRVAQLDNMLTQPSQHGIAEVRNALAEMEKLRDSVRKGSADWLHYNKMVEQGKAYLDNLAKSEALNRIKTQMNDLQHLSASGLAEVKKYWETMVAGAAQGSTELATYEAELKKVVTEEQERAKVQAQSKVGILGGRNLGQYSETEIRQAIEAGKQLVQTYKTADPAAKALAKNIVAAEEYLKQYGIEAERTAAKEAEALKKLAKQRADNDALMKQQLLQGTALSKSALKAQEQYWQRLIDDPKNAGKSLQQYEANLQNVRALLKAVTMDETRTKGQDALRFFRGNTSNASADLIRENLEALKKYRDSLPQKTHASLIAEINGYIEKTGSAAKVAAGEAMTMKQALQTALDARSGNFKGTVEQLNIAKKTLEQLQQQAVKGGLAWRRMQEGIDGINLELQRTGQLSGEIKAILDTPKGKSFNELKQAVEQGRAALASMRIETGKDREAFDELAAKVKRADFEMKQLGATSRGTASSFEKAMGRLKTYITLYVSAATALQKVTASFADLLDLSDKMGEVRKTTGFTADEVGRLSDNLKKMDTRTTITGLLELSVAAGQLGLKTQEDVEGFTEAANKLMVALPEMGKEGATEMLKVALATGEIAKIDRQMKQGIIDGSSATAVAMEKVGSTIDRLRATSAATAPAITDFVKRVGAVGAQSGITIDQVAALGSTVDALGMRVEMSATALSRMIPAIKNNAFEVAKAIKVAPNELRDLFAAGRGMEAILMIFQHIKDAGLDDEGIEKMLGMGGMQDVMKQLNQQGARAGIVFAGLSQNVEELRRQLGVAGQAYEENIAIQQEYDKMNETTAAKWERFKNQLEEMFVNDSMQRWLGGIVDTMRIVLDLFVKLKDYAMSFMFSFGAWKLGVGGAIWTYLINPLRLAVIGVQSLGTQITVAAAKWRTAWRTMDAASKANLIFAIASAVFLLGKAIWDAVTNIDTMTLSLAKLDNEEAAAERDANRLTSSLEKAIPKANEAANKHSKLKKETEELRKEVDTLKSSTDKNTEAHDKLSKKEEELKQKEKELKSASDELNKANKTRSGLIAEINSKYSTYLGYMLNEKTAAEQVALAHLQIVDALKEELEQKRLNKEIEGVDEKHNEGIEKAGARSAASLTSLPEDMQRQIRSRWNTVRGSIRYSVNENGKASYTLPAIDGLTSSEVTKGSYAELRKDLEKVFSKIVRTEVDRANKVKGRDGKEIRLDFGSSWQAQGSTQYGSTNYGTVSNTLDNFITQAFKSFDQWTEKTLKRESEIEERRQESEAFKKGVRTTSIADANTMNEDAYNRIIRQMSHGTEKAMENIDDLAQQVNIITANLNKFNGELDRTDKYIGKDNDATVENVVKTMFNAFTEEQRKQIINAAKKVQKGEAGGIGEGGAGSTRSIWGTEPEATTTEYSLMSVDELVARRNQMDRFKNALRPDTDIRKALAEDVALMKAINDGKVQPNMKDVIDWYNAERKKIEQELKSEKYSTNEGHWAAEAKTGRRKNLMPETDYALAELDRYYSRRKETLEKARIKENMSEELYNRQAELLEQEHLERRSKLRGSFTGEITKEEAKAFDEWWKTLEKNFELDRLERDKITAEWAKANAGQTGRNNYRMQQDMTKMEEITVKHLNKIAAIVAKERPYDGIVENLRKNLTDMDILLADVQKNGPAEDPALLVKEQTARLQFLLGEAETAYQSTIDDVLKRMADAGMTAWAEEVGRSDAMKNALMAQLQKAYDAIQEAIKKESSQIRKQMDIWWNDLVPGQDQSRKGVFEKALSQLGLQEDQVKRANSLIGAGAASERVADKLAIKQMQIRLQMQQVYYNRMRQMWDDRIRALREQGKEIDAQHAKISKQLSLSEEQKKVDEQRVAIANQLEESQNRLYTQLKEWGDLLASGMRDVFEASNAGNAEYYNELAKMNLTGKGGPGAGTYIVIDNEGTEDATAHYEYLSEREALERQREIEQQNAQAEAWKKLWDDLNNKMSEQITDWINASLQNDSIDANTRKLDELQSKIDEEKVKIDENIAATNDSKNANTQAAQSNIGALSSNTEAVIGLTQAILGKKEEKPKTDNEGNPEPSATDVSKMATTVTDVSAEEGESSVFLPGVTPGLSWTLTEEQMELVQEQADQLVQIQTDAFEKVRIAQEASFGKRVKKEDEADKQMLKSSQSMYAKMALAANMYGIAYQAMSNENLSTTQKFEMMALQAVGNYAISSLTATMSKAVAQGAVDEATVLGKLWSQLGWAAAPVFAIFTGLLGAGMAAAMSAVTKSKSQIAQATGASASAGRLATGMMTYAEGNVNEFTDPGSLTPGRQYNVDGADGRTYRARYMGSNPKTHLTNGPEFHLAGERGREMIIDAGTTRQITMNENEIWHAIQTLSAGGRMPSTRRRGRGVRAFAEGNVEDFEEVSSVMGDGMTDTGPGFDPVAMQSSLDRNSAVQEALLERLNQPIYAQNILYGPDGLPNVIAKLQKEAKKHGEKYL